MKNRLLRTFISIPVPNSVKNVKQMLTSTCEDEKVVIRWVKHNNLHITLQFLGFTPEKDISQIKELLLKKLANGLVVPDILVTNVVHKLIFPLSSCALMVLLSTAV